MTEIEIVDTAEAERMTTAAERDTTMVMGMTRAVNEGISLSSNASDWVGPLVSAFLRPFVRVRKVPILSDTSVSAMVSRLQ